MVVKHRSQKINDLGTENTDTSAKDGQYHHGGCHEYTGLFCLCGFPGPGVAGKDNAGGFGETGKRQSADEGQGNNHGYRGQDAEAAFAVVKGGKRSEINQKFTDKSV